MDRSLLDDPAAVAAMAAGNPVGLEAVYRRYADRLYAYARSIVDDGDTAADVVQETFLLAQERVRQLRDPARLGSWLYAIARNECLGRLRARKRTVMLAESHEPVLDTDPGRAVHAAQVRELVHAAAAGMNDGDREVIELTVRHAMSAADVARVLEVSEKHAHARISRARSQFEGALGALVLARDGRGRCEQLDAIVRGWDGQLTALLRKRIERHVRDCEVCSQRRRERMNPAGLLASYATLPFFAVAAQLWPQLRVKLGASLGEAGSSAAGSGPAGSDPAGSGPAGSGPAGSGAPGGPSGGHGPASGAEPPTIPVQMGAEPTVALQAGGAPAGGPSPAPVRRSNRGLMLGAAVAVLIIILGVSAVRLLTLDRAAPVTSPGATPDTSAVASPSPQPSPTPSPSPAPPPAFTITADGHLCAGPSNQLIVSATASVPLAQARIFYQQPPGGTTKDRGMSVSGSTADVAFSDWSFAPEVRWWVRGTATDGRTFTTSPTTTTFAAC